MEYSKRRQGMQLLRMLLITAAGMLLIGCNGKKSPSQEPEGPGKSEDTNMPAAAGETQTEPEERGTEESRGEALTEPAGETVPEYKQAYYDVVKEHAYESGNYIWQYGLDVQGSMPVAKREQTPYALLDITGDSVPELFLMGCTPENAYSAYLNIYTIGEDGKAKEMFSRDWDIQAAGGTVHYVFQGADHVCYGYNSIADEWEYASWYTFTPGSDGILQMNEIMTRAEGPNEDYTETVGEYTIEGQSVPKEAYDARAAQIIDNMAQMILYNDNYGPEAFEKKLDTIECVSMAQGELIRHLLVTEPLGQQALPFSQPLRLNFSSGAGAWGTELTLNPDGTFTGTYLDSNMGEDGDGYGATEYVCDFSGKFGNIQKEDDDTYTMTLEYCSTERPAGEEWIDEERIRHVAAEPYGISGGSTFKLYLPGTPVASLPEEYISWIWGLSKKTLLPQFGLYNVEEQNGFM